MKIFFIGDDGAVCINPLHVQRVYPLIYIDALRVSHFQNTHSKTPYSYIDTKLRKHLLCT